MTWPNYHHWFAQHARPGPKRRHARAASERTQYPSSTSTIASHQRPAFVNNISVHVANITLIYRFACKYLTADFKHFYGSVWSHFDYCDVRKPFDDFLFY